MRDRAVERRRPRHSDRRKHGRFQGQHGVHLGECLEGVTVTAETAERRRALIHSTGDAPLPAPWGWEGPGNCKNAPG